MLSRAAASARALVAFAPLVAMAIAIGTGVRKDSRVIPEAEQQSASHEVEEVRGPLISQPNASVLGRAEQSIVFVPFYARNWGRSTSTRRCEAFNQSICLHKSRDRAQNGRHRASASRPDQLSNAVAPDGSLQTPESKWLGPGQGTFIRLHSFNHHPSGIEPLGRNQSGTTPIEVILLHTQQMRAASLPHCLTQSHNITATYCVPTDHRRLASSNSLQEQGLKESTLYNLEGSMNPRGLALVPLARWRI
ncbi:hypothetical protein M430DRAFT_27364 [Amorphotheca resinae ATCC 22711]|uniref:Uncharacterized protein n=1 Tax=Amorphotheca resinae ATCC 22711 TaxID=857342 RepID=A0A2T3B3T1_AMORE|nr:hypothetical protein M430DRAFT_27364 [Amorphotheca resinae ATCC 22711]PSS20304.1 hypothetical protein M430DRAFT_27364 [Amorphotheca resinae ATCC 22711]